MIPHIPPDSNLITYMPDSVALSRLEILYQSGMVILLLFLNHVLSIPISSPRNIVCPITCKSLSLLKKE